MIPSVETGGAKMTKIVNKIIKPRNVSYKYLVFSLDHNELLYNDIQTIRLNSGFLSAAEISHWAIKYTVTHHGHANAPCWNTGKVNKLVNPKCVQIDRSPIVRNEHWIILPGYATSWRHLPISFSSMYCVHSNQCEKSVIMTSRWLAASSCIDDVTVGQQPLVVK